MRIKRIMTATLAVTMTIALSANVFAAGWQKNDTGWWYDNGDGTWAHSGWFWLDDNQDGIAECYFFDQNGYMMSDWVSVDGFNVNSDGAWVVDGVVQIRVNNSDSTNVVMNLTNHANQTNIAESGSFRAEDNQTLTLNITSDIKGGEVNLFLFDPNGKEQRITIGSTNMTKEIALEKGTWQYNCSGVFKDGGNIKIVGTIK